MDKIIVEYIKPEEMLRKSPDIETMSDYYQTVSDILEGFKAIRAGRERYLPKFSDDTDTEYQYKLSVAKFTNIFRDTLEALACKPFENKITLKATSDKNGQPYIPEILVDFVDDVDGHGNDLTTFSSLTFFNALAYGTDWIFVDFPDTKSEVMSVSKAKELKLKPYWTHVTAKNVLDAKTKRRGSETIVSYFKYLEVTYGDQPKRVREYQLSINPETGNEEVVWKLWVETKRRRDDGSLEIVFVVRESGVMSKDKIPAVPYFTGRRDGNSFKTFPLYQDASDLQIILYQDESDLQYTKKLAGYPILSTDGQPVIDPVTKRPTKIKGGPNTVLYGAPMQNGVGGTWRYVEPNANSMEFLKKDIDRTKSDLRELARQPLTSQSSQLTNTTTAVAAGKAKSAVINCCWLLEDAIENALLLTLEWFGESDDGYKPSANVYTGFDNIIESGGDLDTLNDARTRNDLSRKTYWTELKRRRILSPEFDEKIELNNLLDEVPSDNSPDTGEDYNTNQQEDIKND